MEAVEEDLGLSILILHSRLHLSLPFRISNQRFLCISHLSRACYIPASLIVLALVNLIIFGGV